MLRSVIAAVLGTAVGCFGVLLSFFKKNFPSVCMWEAGRVYFDDQMSLFQ